MDIDQANTTAVNRLMEARPILKAVATARDVIPGMKDNLFLHAGPPIEWARMSGPLRGAVIGAMLFERLAANETEAMQIVGEHKGNITAAAKQAGKSRQAMGRTYQNACRKLGISAARHSDLTARPLPSDRRGQVSLPYPDVPSGQE